MLLSYITTRKWICKGTSSHHIKKLTYLRVFNKRNPQQPAWIFQPSAKSSDSVKYLHQLRWIKKCIQTYTYEYSKPLHAYPLLQIDKPLLAATLYNLSCQAEKKDIGIQFDVVSDKLESHASEVDLSDYLSILMQNAIEACSPGDKIYVHLSSADGQTQFEIRNPVPKFISSDEITNFFKNGYTTKALIEKGITFHMVQG